MLKWLKDVFSDASCASFARLSTACTVGTGCWSLIYLVLHNHALPDTGTLVALGVWMTSPYAINKFTAGWGKDAQSGPASVGPIAASAETTRQSHPLPDVQKLLVLAAAIVLILALMRIFPHP